MTDRMKAQKLKKLLDKLERLESYQYQYTSRSVNINAALGMRGSKLLEEIYDLRNELTQ